MFPEIQSVYLRLHGIFELPLRDPPEPGKHGEEFSAGESVNESIKLRTVANALLHQPQFSANVVTSNKGGAAGWCDVSREHFESGGLSGSVHPQQSKTLTIGNDEIHTPHRQLTTTTLATWPTGTSSGSKISVFLQGNIDELYTVHVHVSG